MVENTRFYKEETKNEPEFVEKLANAFELFVNNTFGTATMPVPQQEVLLSSSHPKYEWPYGSV